MFSLPHPYQKAVASIKAFIDPTHAITEDVISSCNDVEKLRDMAHIVADYNGCLFGVRGGGNWLFTRISISRKVSRTHPEGEPLSGTAEIYFSFWDECIRITKVCGFCVA